MNNRLFELVVVSCDKETDALVSQCSVSLLANNFDSSNDHLITIQIAVTEEAETASSSHKPTSQTSLLSYDRSKEYLKKYQITDLPCLVIRSKIAEEQSVSAVQIVRPRPHVNATNIEVGKIFTDAISAYNEFRLVDAIQRFERVLLLDAHHKQALFNLASIVHMLGFPTLAVGYTVRLLTEDPDDTIAHSFLWALNNSGECSSAAVKAYRYLSSRGDLRATTKLATLTGRGSQAVRGDPQYAQQIYDDMGEIFESKLVDHLGYRGPWLMHDMLEQLAETSQNIAAEHDGAGVSEEAAPLALRPKGGWRILDVGCGSGLCGEVFSEYVRGHTSIQQSLVEKSAPVTITANSTNAAVEASPEGSAAASPALLSLLDVPLTAGGLMVGIDVSAKMVEITARKGVYHIAERWDLTDALMALGCCPSDVACVGAVAGTEHKADISTASNSDGAQCSSARKIGLDMVIAADTFIYVGALGEVFSLVHKVLRGAGGGGAGDGSSGDDTHNISDVRDGGGGGLFMFSTEDLELSPMRIQSTANTALTDDTLSTAGAAALDDTAAAAAMKGCEEEVKVGVEQDKLEIPGAVPGWGAQLLSSARFAHSDRYVRALCEKHGFRVVQHRRIVLRTEETIPLPGNIYILQAM